MPANAFPAAPRGEISMPIPQFLLNFQAQSAERKLKISDTQIAELAKITHAIANAENHADCPARIIDMRENGPRAMPVVEFPFPRGLGTVTLIDSGSHTYARFKLLEPLRRSAFGEMGLFNPEADVLAQASKYLPEDKLYPRFADNQSHFTVRMKSLESGFPLELITLVVMKALSMTPKPAPAADPDLTVVRDPFARPAR